MMIFVTFWSLNPNLPPTKMAEVAAQLMQKGLFPVKGVKQLGLYICPGGRGVTISEIEGENAAKLAFEDFAIWLKQMPGYFASYETFPAITAEESISIVLK